jgi:hypothetical protein
LVKSLIAGTDVPEALRFLARAARRTSATVQMVPGSSVKYVLGLAGRADVARRAGVGSRRSGRQVTMKISLRRRATRPETSRPAETAMSGMTLAEVMMLPAVTDLVSAGKALGMGRTRSYELARAGTFPCRVMRVGRTYQVPTAGLLTLLGISLPRTNCAGEDGI